MAAAVKVAAADMAVVRAAETDAAGGAARRAAPCRPAARRPRRVAQPAPNDGRRESRSVTKFDMYSSTTVIIPARTGAAHSTIVLVRTPISARFDMQLTCSFGRRRIRRLAVSQSPYLT